MIYYTIFNYEQIYYDRIYNPTIYNPISLLEETILYLSAQTQRGGKARKNKGKDWINRGGSTRRKKKTQLHRKKKRRSK